MKIVLPVHHFPPRYSAGAEVYTYRLAKWLLAHGHRPEVVCIEAIDQGRPDAIMTMQDAYDGIPIHRLKTDLMHAPERDHWFYDHPLLGEWFARYIERAKPDLAHFQAGYLIGAAPLRAAAAAGLPTLLTLHDYWFLCPRITLQRGDGLMCEDIPTDPAGCALCTKLASRRFRIPNQITGGMFGKIAQVGMSAGRANISNRRETLRAALALPREMFAPSHFLASRFAHTVPHDRLRVVPLGLDLSPFTDLRHRRHRDDEALRIGFIGQIAPHKGVYLLIQAFRQLRLQGKRAELHIYGNLDANPDYTQRLRALAQGDPNVHLKGRFEPQRLPKVLASLSVVVVPSVWYENSPLVILESRAAGAPVLVSALGGMPEFVQDEVDGLHVKPNDAPDLARQIQRLMDEPKLLARLRAGVAANPPRSIEDEMGDLMRSYERAIGARALEATHVA